MIKVVQVSSDTNIGGAGKCILTFLRHYDRKRFDITAVLPPDSLLKPLIEELDVPVVEIDGIAEKSLSIGSIGKLKKCFKELKPDIVHTHASMSARIAAKLCGAGIVYTRHSVFPPSKRLSSGIGKRINGFVNNHTADAIIAVAEAAKQNLTDTGVDEKKIRVVLNGVDPLKEMRRDAEFLLAENRYGVKIGERVAAIIARLNEVKGHKYFVDAAKIVKDSGIPVKFIIAGTGDEEENIRKHIAELGLEDTVVMAGFVSDVTPLMNLMDVQINCSFGTEATSLSLLEGMSLGKPAVVTDFGGNPGVIKNGQNGFLVPTHSAGEIAQAIIRLLSDEALYKKMSAKSREIYNSVFTSEKYAENIQAVYDAVYEEKQGGNSSEG